MRPLAIEATAYVTSGPLAEAHERPTVRSRQQSVRTNTSAHFSEIAIPRERHGDMVNGSPRDTVDVVIVSLDAIASIACLAFAYLATVTSVRIVLFAAGALGLFRTYRYWKRTRRIPP